jgi:hypothetical protein
MGGPTAPSALHGPFRPTFYPIDKANITASTRDTDQTETESETYVTTDGLSASLSWNKAPILGLRSDLYYCLTVASLLIWGAFSDERTGLSFTIAAGSRQRSHFRVRVPYFTVSDLRLPFSSPPTTSRDWPNSKLVSLITPRQGPRIIHRSSLL